jgi:hypothetical protein
MWPKYEKASLVSSDGERDFSLFNKLSLIEDLCSHYSTVLSLAAKKESNPLLRCLGLALALEIAAHRLPEFKALTGDEKGRVDTVRSLLLVASLVMNHAR